MDAGVQERSVLPSSSLSRIEMSSASSLRREEADIQAAEAILSIAPTHHSAKSSVSYPAPLPPFKPVSPRQPSSPAHSRNSFHDDGATKLHATAMRQSLPSLSEALGRQEPPGAYTRERSPPRAYLRRSASPRASRVSRELEPYPPHRQNRPTYRELSPVQQHAAPRATAYAPISATSPSSPRHPYSQQWSMPPHSQASHASYTRSPNAASPSWTTPQSARPASVHQSSSFAAQPFYAQQHTDERPPSHAQPQYVTSYPALSTSSLPPSHESSWPSGDKYADSGRQLSKEHSDAVRKQLEHFDIEASLNDIHEGSHNLFQFSQTYMARQHHSARSNSGTEPSIDDVREAMRFHQSVGDSLARILQKLEAQEAERIERSAQEAMEKEKLVQKQAAEQQHPAAPTANHERRISGPTVGPEVKKRRGRQALPGRCHSCQRSETPEWRRGPDGARTLCNACGLHYAKHARKQGANKVALGSSSLRQKPMSNS